MLFILIIKPFLPLRYVHNVKFYCCKDEFIETYITSNRNKLITLVYYIYIYLRDRNYISNIIQDKLILFHMNI